MKQKLDNHGAPNPPRIQILVNEDEHHEIKAACALAGISMSEQGRILFLTWLYYENDTVNTTNNDCVAIEGGIA